MLCSTGFGEQAQNPGDPFLPLPWFMCMLSRAWNLVAVTFLEVGVISEVVFNLAPDPPRPQGVGWDGAIVQAPQKQIQMTWEGLMLRIN